MKLRPVVKTHGGKFYVHPWLIENFPTDYQSMHYGEPCCGGASVLLNKERSVTERYNDADIHLTHLVQTLAQHGQEFLDILQSVPYSEETFLKAKAEVDSGLNLAINQFIVRRMSRGGLQKAFSWSERLRGGRPGDLNAFETFKKHLPHIIERLQGVEFSSYDICEFLTKFDSDNTFFYIDPPYLPSTRRSPQAYNVEMTEKEHITMGELVKNVQAKVMISGYPSQLYMKMFSEWNMATLPVANHSGQNKKKEMRIEVVWRNY